MAREIIYPVDLDKEENVRAKAEAFFEANKLLNTVQMQYDCRVMAALLPGAGWFFSYTIICSICGAVVDQAKKYCDMHLELHIKNGE